MLCSMKKKICFRGGEWERKTGPVPHVSGKALKALLMILPVSIQGKAGSQNHSGPLST